MHGCRLAPQNAAQAPASHTAWPCTLARRTCGAAGLAGALDAVGGEARGRALGVLWIIVQPKLVIYRGDKVLGAQRVHLAQRDLQRRRRQVLRQQVLRRHRHRRRVLVKARRRRFVARAAAGGAAAGAAQVRLARQAHLAESRQLRGGRGLAGALAEGQDSGHSVVSQGEGPRAWLPLLLAACAAPLAVEKRRERAATAGCHAAAPPPRGRRPKCRTGTSGPLRLANQSHTAATSDQQPWWVAGRRGRPGRRRTYGALEFAGAWGSPGSLH